MHVHPFFREASTARAIRPGTAVYAAGTSALGHAALIVLLVAEPLELVQPIAERHRPSQLVAFAEVFSEAPTLEGMPRPEILFPKESNAPDVELWKPPHIEPVALDAFERADEVASIDDVEQVERLQKIYVRQLSARIERVLIERGFSGSLSPGARCVLSIVQSEEGRVLDVDYGGCGLVESNRERLSDALRAASPLPAPPDGLAMGSFLKLDLSDLLSARARAGTAEEADRTLIPREST